MSCARGVPVSCAQLPEGGVQVEHLFQHGVVTVGRSCLGVKVVQSVENMGKQVLLLL